MHRRPHHDSSTSHVFRPPAGKISWHIQSAAAQYLKAVGSAAPVDGTFKEVLALLGRHDKTAWNALVKQLNPSRVGRDFAERTATLVHRNLGSLPAHLPAQLRFHACLLTHNALPTRMRTRSFSAGGLAGWHTPNTSCILCGGGREDLEHLHTQCPVTATAVGMIAQHSPATRTYVTEASADSFIFRSDPSTDALLHLLCLSRAIWQTRKAHISSAHAHMDTKVRKENAAAITDHFLELLKGCTKPKRSPRDRAAEGTRFLQTLEHVEEKAFLYFTDGSSFGNPGPSGAGFAAYCDNSLVDSAAFSLGETSNNVAELHGLREALADARSRHDPHGCCPPRRIYIFTDNLYALNVSIGKWKAKAHRPLIATIQKLITDLRRSSFLTIGWVPGHADVEGNEAADKLAKLGAQACSPDQIPTPMRTAQPNPDRTLPTRLSPSEEAPSLPPSPQPLRRSHRPHTQPRALARGIDFSSFHAPKRRAHPPTECPHGVPLLLDRRSTGPPCLRCITLSPRDASLSPIRLRMDDSGIALDSPPIPLVDVNFDEVTNSSADHFGISLRRPSLSPPISPTLAPSSVSDPSTGIPTIP